MSQSDTIPGETLKYLINAGSVRALKAVQSQADGKWCLVAQVGMDEITVRSKREPVRTWASIDSIARYCRERFGVVDFEVKGAA